LDRKSPSNAARTARGGPERRWRAEPRRFSQLAFQVAVAVAVAVAMAVQVHVLVNGGTGLLMNMKASLRVCKDENSDERERERERALRIEQQGKQTVAHLSIEQLQQHDVLAAAQHTHTHTQSNQIDKKRNSTRSRFRSTCGGRWPGQTRRTPPWRSTSAGRCSARPESSHRSRPSTCARAGR
jgi:glucose/arabinose dehydrogenase